jgi:hypothetical protein
MKTYLTWLPASLIVLAGALISPVQKVFIGRNTVTKSVDFAVYKGNDYSAEAYKNTSAQVHIVVEKVSAKSRITVWDTTIDATELKDFPTAENAKAERITVPGIVDKKEHLEITYLLTYDSRGSQLQMQGGTAVYDNSGKMDISI